MLFVHFRPVRAVLFLFFVMQANVVVGSKPSFRWAPLEGLEEAEKLRIEHLARSRCLPKASDVSVPVYPSTVLVDIMWGRVQPSCELREGWSSLGGLRLVSKESFEDVVTWYRQHLVGYVPHQAPKGTIFLKGEIQNYLWDRDYYKHRNISILPVEGGFQVAGYVTMIEINRPGEAR